MQVNVVVGTPSTTTVFAMAVMKHWLNETDAKLQSVPCSGESESVNASLRRARSVSCATAGPIALTAIVNVKVCGWTT